VAVRTEQAKVFQSVVQPVTVDVIDHQDEWAPLPRRFEGTSRALPWDAGRAQCRAQRPGLRTARALRKDNENVAPVSARGYSAAAVTLSEKVRRINSSPNDSTADVRVLAAGHWYAKGT